MCPGWAGTEYIYPHLAPGYDDSLAYFAEAGLDVVRLPFRWERLQPELNAHCIGATYWVAGPWYQEYALSIDRRDGAERPQMGVLREHLAFECER